MNTTYQEHGYKIIVKKTKPTGKILKNMRDGKVFFDNEKLSICYDSEIHEVLEGEYTDDVGNKVSVDDLNIDTYVRVGGIIRRGDEVLLFHRVKPDIEYYVFPGGHQLVKESPEEALIRELKEETGIDISSEQIEHLVTIEIEGFGLEKYFYVNDVEDFSKLLSENPDVEPGETNEPVFMKISEVKEMENVFPKKVVERLRN
jgi:8-oxo-dGTP pyrophosphatase MutT (NUDIX family)